MIDPDRTPDIFEEKPKSRWVWIVPSLIFHLAVLGIWLNSPPREPREPGDRELTIRPDQAELLQQHVEDANLMQLRQQVSELQEIKESMAGIREERMTRIHEFESERARPAPLELDQLLKKRLEGNPEQ